MSTQGNGTFYRHHSRRLDSSENIDRDVKMPKLLFSKIRFYEIRDFMQNVKRSRSWETDHKLHPTLENLLRDKKYLAAFRTFLQSEFSEENIEFWLACEEFRSNTPQDKLRWKAQEIYQEFIQPAASREINVDHHIREKIKKSLENPSLSCFDEAQKQVYLLMERDSCPRFLNSDAYLSLKHKSRTLWYI
ncbi:regulator of G-protein signaling 21-like isoform X2 [Mastacembelus armatus]|uniref:regulator of G-protein signaling 21-like isoform X2 n=1 Tax=Mastacembelus armatus TaxID=205130 RepID=UPI000E45C2FB|nr:regulator of G-protein signaling 21-like isoform X2 [Mastacembelus armatus]